ncbi:MAG TPA: tyrosine-type recombinase/integrase, partial [Kineosporiaceae bacterium]
PLARFAEGFADELSQVGYTSFSTRDLLGVVAHFSRWLQDQGLEAGDVDEAVAERFLAARRAAGYRWHRRLASLVPLLAYLRRLGVIAPPSAATAQTPTERELERFRKYLLTERGLTPASAKDYVSLVRPFVADRVGTAGVDPARATSGEVNAFLVAATSRLGAKTVQRSASALRALLRFWHLDGVLSVPLAEAVPKVAHRAPQLPRGLPPEQVAAMLASCDTGRVDGLRDRAMMLLMARLGLRCGEVAALRLEDIDWRAGQVSVRGKGGRRDLLPLPVEVGQAIADYLQAGRPATAIGRTVFVRVLAPHRALSSTGVTQAVAAAARRAGLGTVYGHRLRHSAATAMLAAGGSLTEIGQVLRHRRPATTAIYARVDVEALRTLARPWPRARS